MHSLGNLVEWGRCVERAGERWNARIENRICSWSLVNLRLLVSDQVNDTLTETCLSSFRFLPSQLWMDARMSGMYLTSSNPTAIRPIHPIRNSPMLVYS